MTYPPNLDPEAPAPRPTLFFSDPAAPALRGMRAGWRLLIFLAWLVLLAYVLRLVEHLAGTPKILTTEGFAPLSTLAGEALVFAVVLVATAIMAGLERRPLGVYGLPARRVFRGEFWWGVLWGFVGLTALLLFIHANGDYHFGSLALHGQQVATFGGEWALAFLAVGFFEEYAFRGYALYTLSSGMTFWPAAALLSLCFGAVHLGNGGEDLVGALSAGLIGLFFCYTVRRTGTLWFAVGLHASWDWGETFFFGVPNSGTTAPGHLLSPPPSVGSKWITGGSVGPEGSLWVFLVIALMWVVFERWSRQSGVARQRATA